MLDVATRYAAWKAPRQDGQTLLWPSAAALLDDARQNNRALNSANSVRLQGVPLPKLRQSMRRFIGVDRDDQLLIASGHQTELHHPGVWAKNVLADAAARASGGVAVHVAVDTDAPKHLVLGFPGFAEPFTDDPEAATAQWSGLVSPPSPSHLANLSEAIAGASADWPFESLLGGMLDIFRRQSLEAEHLPKALTSAMHAMDWNLGVRYTALLASPIWISEPFLVLAHHLLARASDFAADYNAALQAYRLRQGIRTPGRPMPNLAVAGDRCEAPFWFDDLTTGRRERAAVEQIGGRWTLSRPGDSFALDPAADALEAAGRLQMWLRRHNCRLSPRALALTLCLRLLMADQFIHGIGGGQYDQVTDDVITRHFRLEPPRFAVTTATLYWPPAAGRTRIDLPALKQAGHQLRHNLLGPAKEPMLQAINAAPRKSRQRLEQFHSLHHALDQAAAQTGALAKWEDQLRDATAEQSREKGLFDRELFYAIQPRDRLEQLMGVYRDAFA